VELSGEAYFEVAKNAAMPFNVTAKDMVVRVLGTHFNIMAYGDEKSLNTTLLEGAVKVTRGGSTGILKPGQQASFAQEGGDVKITPADTDEAVAWKNGIFQFSGDDIEKIMRQISRWYDVGVSFDGKVPDGHYTGTISRNVPVSKALHLLELNGLHFKISGKNITVLATQ
jgi:ferric-dicitrate binding protein FerR (iron transport regulator)